jgi:hypothetical protein
VERRNERASHSLATAQTSIALSAVAGGMYEIGDDLLVLNSEKDRYLKGKGSLLEELILHAGY